MYLLCTSQTEVRNFIGQMTEKLVRDELQKNRFELLKDLVRFFKEYMPRYGYKHLCTEDDDYKYYQTLNLPCIKRGFMGYHCNYGAPLSEIEV